MPYRRRLETLSMRMHVMHDDGKEVERSLPTAGFRKTGEVVEKKNSSEIRGQIAKVSMQSSHCESTV